MNKGEHMAALAVEVSEAAKWDQYLSHAAAAVKGATTDRRVMNNMDAGTKAIHLRLEAWARWSQANPELREYPEESWLHKWAKYGTDGASQAGPPVSMPEAVGVIEAAIRKLGDIDRKVLTRYYLSWKPVDVLAVTCRMRKPEFLNVLRRARFRVRCYVEALEA